MKHVKLGVVFLVMSLAFCFTSQAQGLKAFKLKNGLSVFIWEDKTQSDVYGMVGVRTGSVNDPEQYTGLAHYLEHVMFKGTQKIGALNWEEEKPIYEQIVAKYDEMANEQDPIQKAALNKEINELTIKAGSISTSNEFSDLIEGMGGKSLNAGTSFDYTIYHNSFPSYQINKWLEISSERFINPVFRTFQTELETVYEEYNMGKDNSNRLLSEFVFSKAFDNHPYGRSVIGLGEHLKNPRLSQLIKYYTDWYTPENMVLILVGNIEAKQITGRVASTFGRLEAKPTAERKVYPEPTIKERKQYTSKFSSHQPSVVLIYNGVKAGHPDELATEIVLKLLNNSSRTGLLDKLTIDGELMGGFASPMTLREQGKNMIYCYPLYDENQRRFESNKATEKKALKTIEQIASGDYEEWIVEAIKAEMCRDFDLGMESNQSKAYLLNDAFINERDMANVLGYKDAVMSVSGDDIKRVAKQYLSNNYIVLYNEKGKPDKNLKIKKPGIKPIEPPVGQSSMYAKQFKTMPISSLEEKYVDMADVKTKKINDRSNLFYSQNVENDVFTLLLQYGAGSELFPKLEFAAELMNNAGIMGLYEPQELKKELSKLNATCSVSATDSYLRIMLRGNEANLQAACQLLTKQILMPKLDDKQLSNLKGGEISSRISVKDNMSLLADALEEYIVYQKKSHYINSLTDKEVIDLQISELTGDVNRASNYESEIHYSGSLPFDNVYQILSTSLPLVAGEKASTSPVVREVATYTENTVFFLPNTDALQSQIYIYFPLGQYNKENDAIQTAFNQYFTGGFSGLVMSEIREKNSMAYTAYGYVIPAGLENGRDFFSGYIGTQNDKAVDALTLFTKLLTDMPLYPDRMDNIKSYIRQTYLTSHPNFRSKSQVFQSWKRRGYTEDPSKTNVAKIDGFTFDDIVKYYNEHIKGKPIVIGIMGNPKDIDADALKQFGKVIKLNEKKLFNDKDVLF